MTKLNFYKYASLVLLLLNIGVAVFLLSNKDSRPDKHRGEKGGLRIAKMLDLSDVQSQQLKTLGKAHHSELQNAQAEHKEAIKKYLTSTAVDSTSKELLLQKVCQLEINKVQLTKQHLEDIRALLTADQLPQYQDFLKKTTEHIAGHPPRRGRK